MALLTVSSVGGGYAATMFAMLMSKLSTVVALMLKPSGEGEVLYSVLGVGVRRRDLQGGGHLMCGGGERDLCEKPLTEMWPSCHCCGPQEGLHFLLCYKENDRAVQCVSTVPWKVRHAEVELSRRVLQVGNAPCLPLLLRESSKLLPDVEDDMEDLGMIGEKLRAVFVSACFCLSYSVFSLAYAAADFTFLSDLTSEK